MKSLYGKLFAGFFISIAISFSFAGYLGLQSHSQSFRALTEDDLLGMAETVESLLISHHEDFLDELANVSGMTIILVEMCIRDRVTIHVRKRNHLTGIRKSLRQTARIWIKSRAIGFPIALFLRWVLGVFYMFLQHFVISYNLGD